MTPHQTPTEKERMRTSLQCGPEQDGQRLDHALALLLPGMGLRGRKRRIENGTVLVNGRYGTAAQRLRLGDRLELLPAEDKTNNLYIQDDPARLLAHHNGYYFLYKPAALHSSSLAGGNGTSLESRLPQLFPTARSLPVLLQRLDYGTSGIICAAADMAAVKAFRASEAEGCCEKRYLAILEGRLREPALVQNALDTARRKRSVVLSSTAAPFRWTYFWPLHFWTAGELPHNFSSNGVTLAACRIHRGARHQIRAHAAHLGHPLAGDAYYGAVCDPSGSSRFYLHHGAIYFPGASCFVLPPWNFLSPLVRSLSATWLIDVSKCT